MSDTRLYYTDSYGRCFDAAVTSASGDGKRVVLDRTLFYPTSGGQEHDTGQLGGVVVKDVIDEDGMVVHLLAEGLPQQTGRVHGSIDWVRRYDHMQQHTGQHLLSAVLTELFAMDTLSFHMGAELSTIELGAGDLSDRQAEEAEVRVAELVAEARPVHIRFEEAGEAVGLRKVSQRTGTLRVIEIEGLDRSACGGTHVQRTAEIGALQIRGRERVRGHVRIEFVCGQRALRRSRADYRLLTAAARETGASFELVAEWVRKQKERLGDLEKDRQLLSRQLAELRAADLYRSTTPDADGLRCAVVSVNDLDDGSRAFAGWFTSQPKTVLLLRASDPPAVMLAVSEDSGWHAGNRLKEALQELGGRGGGSARVAQGSVTAADLDRAGRVLGFAG